MFEDHLPSRPKRRARRALLTLSAAVLLLFGAVAASSAAPAAGSTPTPTSARVCSQAVAPHYATCLALRRTDRIPNTGRLAPNVTPSGFGRPDLLSAYNLPSTGGSGQTVGIVDAMDDPNAESDLATYRSTYGLPACTTANGCFKKVDENGGTNYPAADTGWAGEISLDLDMVSAVCPSCHIVLVEASVANVSDLGTGVNQAVAQGAKFVSNSYGGSEDGSEASNDAAYFHHPGVAITASSGDGAFQAGTSYPASSRYVTAVGGTALTRSSNARGWSESVWNTSSTEGTGSGCSQDVAKPSWQTDTGCSNRMEADVSAVADPATGVAVYQTYGGSGWAVYGGTSASSPIIASVYALAGTPGSSDTPASYAYAHTGNLYDVTSGNNGSCTPAYFCTAESGYDGPTGLGTPNGLGAFTSGSAPTETVSVTSPGSQTSTVNTAISNVQISASDSAGKALTYTATGLPAGLSISSSGLISGTPTATGTSNVTVTASSGTASGSASFSWTVNPAGGGGGIVNGGFESGSLTGWTSTGVTAVTTSGPHSGTYAAQVGSTSPSNNSTIAQTFTAPAGKTTLSFYYNITCPDTVTYDWATATLKDNTSGTTKTVLAKTCVSSSGWTLVSSAVTAGHSYTLTLTSHDDNYPGDPTYTKYDDVSMS